MYKLPRRELLKSTLGGLLLAPLLKVRDLEAQNLQPKRFVIFNAAGSFVPEYFPTGGGGDWQLRGPMLPFQGLEQDMLFIRQLNHSTQEGNHHEIGMATAYSSSQTKSGDITIDQVIAKKLAEENATPIKYIAHGLYTRFNSPVRSYMTYDGPDRRIVPERDFNKTYQRIFTGVDVSSTPSSPQQHPAVKAFDIAKEDLQKIQKYLGADEKSKLEYHIQSLQDLSRELSAQQPSAQVCKDVQLLDRADSLRDETRMKRGLQNLMGLSTAALQCDRTRVVTMQVGFSGNHYNGLRGFRNGAGGKDPDSWHDWIHHVASDSNHPYYGEWFWMTELWAQYLSDFARSLKAIPEGNGTMLDNTVILWGCEMGIAHSHSKYDVPYTIIGGRNLGINSGQFLRFDRAEEHAKLLTSLKHAFGIMDRGMGNRPDSGPLSGVLV